MGTAKTTAVEEAQKALKAAQKALKEAQAIERKAVAEAQARVAEQALNAADRAIYNWRAACNFPEESLAVYNLMESLRDEFANVAFNANERLEQLNELDPTRWVLDGEFKDSSHNYTEDEDVAHSIATWLFDCNIPKNPGSRPYLETKQDVTDAVGETLALMAFEFYLDGKHDT